MTQTFLPDPNFTPLQISHTCFGDTVGLLKHKGRRVCNVHVETIFHLCQLTPMVFCNFQGNNKTVATALTHSRQGLPANKNEALGPWHCHYCSFGVSGLVCYHIAPGKLWVIMTACSSGQRFALFFSCVAPLPSFSS